MQVDEVFVNEYSEGDIRQCWDFTIGEVIHSLSLDEGDNNFRIWRSGPVGPWKRLGWLFDEDPTRGQFEECGPETEAMVAAFVRQKIAENKAD